ncbi:Fur family transcriptional regulator [Desulfonatronum sp. SC1]|uniref:Fur family transcriptional regulator n=1 Tax=Desulfonatronum sp. SC1 TaxID=2109626 RepID=UPI000D2F59F0|nr:transcriptional repressor [Desulfonatronum sp. SC1]PTN37344.1 transcriptional repressor [Desulfonatronum sp. SC1]
MKRKTQQRQAIQSVLGKAMGPLTIPEIHREALRYSPGLGIATVYRTVRDMLEQCAILQIGIPGEIPRYEDAHRSHHHFFQCRVCSRVFEVHECPTDLHRLVPEGFELEDHEVFLFGRCKDCRGVPADMHPAKPAETIDM